MFASGCNLSSRQGQLGIRNSAGERGRRARHEAVRRMEVNEAKRVCVCVHQMPAANWMVQNAKSAASARL